MNLMISWGRGFLKRIEFCAQFRSSRRQLKLTTSPAICSRNLLKRIKDSTQMWSTILSKGWIQCLRRQNQFSAHKMKNWKERTMRSISLLKVNAQSRSETSSRIGLKSSRSEYLSQEITLVKLACFTNARDQPQSWHLIIALVQGYIETTIKSFFSNTRNSTTWWRSTSESTMIHWRSF